MKFLIRAFLLIGYVLNIVAIGYGVYDAFTEPMTVQAYLHLTGFTALRLVGIVIVPLGAVLGYL